MTDLPLWILVGLFTSWELAAHFTGNRSIHTLSDRIWAVEKMFGWKARVVVGAANVALFLHLVFHLF